MAKLILLSIVIVSIALPIRWATRGSPRRVVRRIQWLTVVFVVVWAYLCLTWYPELVPLQ